MLIFYEFRPFFV